MTPSLRDRSGYVTGLRLTGTVARPVVLATLEAPLTAEAATVAVDAAVESGQPLVVVNAVESSLAPCGLMLGYDSIEQYFSCTWFQLRVGSTTQGGR